MKGRGGCTFSRGGLCTDLHAHTAALTQAAGGAQDVEFGGETAHAGASAEASMFSTGKDLREALPTDKGATDGGDASLDDFLDALETA